VLLTDCARARKRLVPTTGRDDRTVIETTSTLCAAAGILGGFAFKGRINKRVVAFDAVIADGRLAGTISATGCFLSTAILPVCVRFIRLTTQISSTYSAIAHMRRIGGTCAPFYIGGEGIQALSKGKSCLVKQEFPKARARWPYDILSWVQCGLASSGDQAKALFSCHSRSVQQA
jgi:hypothetical protein